MLAQVLHRVSTPSMFRQPSAHLAYSKSSPKFSITNEASRSSPLGIRSDPQEHSFNQSSFVRKASGHAPRLPGESPDSKTKYRPPQFAGDASFSGLGVLDSAAELSPSTTPQAARPPPAEQRSTPQRTSFGKPRRTSFGKAPPEKQGSDDTAAEEKENPDDTANGSPQVGRLTELSGDEWRMMLKGKLPWASSCGCAHAHILVTP